jgi:uncharacterized protein YndB with AHSA1/START domain
MPADSHAVLEQLEGRFALCFERSLSHPPQRVWRALTSHDELLAWHPTPFEVEPRVGGAVRYIPAPGAPEMPDGEVLVYEPPRLLTHTWGEDELRWELRGEAQEGECILTLTHLFDDRFKAARDGAGWHMCLDALSASLRGDAPPRNDGGQELPQGWEELNGDYQQRFGIAPEQATPVPPH